MTISPGFNGFIKGILLVIAGAAVAYVADPSHLTFISGGSALIVAGIASALESYIKDETARGLFGAVRVR